MNKILPQTLNIQRIFVPLKDSKVLEPSGKSKMGKNPEIFPINNFFRFRNVSVKTVSELETEKSFVKNINFVFR